MARAGDQQQPFIARHASTALLRTVKRRRIDLFAGIDALLVVVQDARQSLVLRHLFSSPPLPAQRLSAESQPAADRAAQGRRGEERLEQAAQPASGRRQKEDGARAMAGAGRKLC